MQVQAWETETYPRLLQKPKQVRASYFGDRSGIRSDYHTGTTWAPQDRRQWCRRRAGASR